MNTRISDTLSAIPPLDTGKRFLGKSYWISEPASARALGSSRPNGPEQYFATNNNSADRIAFLETFPDKKKTVVRVMSLALRSLARTADFSSAAPPLAFSVRVRARPSPVRTGGLRERAETAARVADRYSSLTVQTDPTNSRGWKTTITLHCCCCCCCTYSHPRVSSSITRCPTVTANTRESVFGLSVRYFRRISENTDKPTSYRRLRLFSKH